MKRMMKKILSIMIVAMMVFSMSATAFAENGSLGEAKTSGTITVKGNDTVSVNGKEFNAFKILDAELAGELVKYSVPDAMKSFYATEFTLDQSDADFDAKVVAAIDKALKDSEGNDIAEKVEAFAKKALAAAKVGNVTPLSATGNVENTAVFTNVPFGYYLIEDTTNTNGALSAIALDTVNDNLEIELKASVPTVDKKANGESIIESAIGDTVNFEVTSVVTDMTGYNKYLFVVKDTMSKGITFGNEVNITLGGNALDTAAYAVTSTANLDGSTAIEIVLKDFLQYKELKGEAIVITYTGVLNEDAVIGKDANTNKVIIDYSNNPSHDYTGDPQNPDKPGEGDKENIGETPESVTKTYTTAIQIKKVDGNGAPLKGVKFTLSGTTLNKVYKATETFVESEDGTYYLLENGTYSSTKPDGYSGATYKKTVVTSEEITPAEAKYEAEVDDNGYLTFAGIGEGEYTLSESFTPAGFNKIDDIALNITFDKANETFSVAGNKATIVDNIVQLTIVNLKGTLLPSTGGMGTTIFTIAGLALMIGAGILLITKRRMNARIK